MDKAEAKRWQTDQEYKKLMCIFNSFFNFNLSDEIRLIKEDILGPKYGRLYHYFNWKNAVPEDLVNDFEIFRKKWVYFQPSKYDSAIDQFAHFFENRLENLRDVISSAPFSLARSIKTRCKVCNIDRLLEQKLEGL